MDQDNHLLAVSVQPNSTHRTQHAKTQTSYLGLAIPSNAQAVPESRYGSP